MYILLLLIALIDYCLNLLGKAGLALVHFAAFKLTVFVNCKRKHTTNYFFSGDEWEKTNSLGTVDFWQLSPEFL